MAQKSNHYIISLLLFYLLFRISVLHICIKFSFYIFLFKNNCKNFPIFSSTLMSPFEHNKHNHEKMRNNKLYWKSCITTSAWGALKEFGILIRLWNFSLWNCIYYTGVLLSFEQINRNWKISIPDILFIFKQ